MKVLMIGAGRDVRGGVSSVVNSYYEAGLDERCELTYLPTMEDGGKLKKIIVAVVAYIRFCFLIEKREILHVHMSVDKSFYRKAFFIKKAFKQKKKIIIHVHSGNFDAFYGDRCTEKQKKQVRDIFAMANKVIVLSEYWREFFGKYICDLEKIQVIWNGIKIPKSYKKDYENQNILFLGVLMEHKGIYVLLKILPSLFRKFPDARVYLCGEGDKERLEDICRREGIEKQVFFSGWIRGEEKAEYLKNSSIFVLPTYHEGMPMSVLEAMAYGLGIVTSQTGGIPYLIKDEEEGFLCQPGDEKQLESSLEKMLSSVELRRKLGMAAAKRAAQKFNIEHIVRSIIAVYREV